MATPTPSTNTPQKHLAALSSPAPRSVPPINFDSPAVLNMLSEGGVGMGISMSGLGMSQLGLSASQMGRADEDERRRRLESIITMLKGKPGRVSAENITALCGKEGIVVDHEESTDKSNVTLTLVIGNEAMCDIAIAKGNVMSVKLELASDDDIFKDSVSRILYKSLKPPPGVNKINVTLDRFAHNLEKLLRMDKLSAENGGVPVYKAIFKVYNSLRKLFEHEKKMTLAIMDANTPNAGYKAEREVLCKKSGRPRMNAGTCLGLSLEYWMDRRHLIPKKPRESASIKGKEKMDVDSEAADEYSEDIDSDTNRIYSLTIECESSPSSMYTPIRIPDSWLSEAVEKAPDGPDADINNILLNTSQIDWLDPKPTYLEPVAPAGDHDSMNLGNAPGRLPNIRFVARFNPPLVVPWTEYVRITQNVGVEYNPQDLRATTFVGLAIRPGDVDPAMMGTAGGYTPEVRSERNVLVLDKDGKERQTTHANSLYVPKLEYARALESLPFSHPRQLVELLPTLRQYAFTTSLLQHTFVSKAPPPSPKQTSHASPLSPPLTPKETTPARPPLQLDLTLSYTAPSPRLTLQLPHPSSSTALPTDPAALLASLLATTTTTSSPITNRPALKVTLDVLPNADLYITEQNVVPPHADQGRDADVDMDRAHEADELVKQLARALDVCADLGVWGEWLRREVVRRDGGGGSAGR
ncbi:hypothetical protein BU26DRAFT_523499 [Trematosphaeria pertusa]|uniref:Mediator of RNA polymerase II transcription subunit 1 n=1 Tax=Trematosphaeria pertusa TaxID=390896 RepID=A0A6A6I260_9PLEO|nr:uncharacterized protein BU26DRAFT_523499 [Trematosphaeria pertusa]KAF2243953.1 hypothetical protein BU26DRAFT_523499 [Trematosphaeria pertusa]